MANNVILHPHLFHFFLFFTSKESQSNHWLYLYLWTIELKQRDSSSSFAVFENNFPKDEQKIWQTSFSQPEQKTKNKILTPIAKEHARQTDPSAFRFPKQEPEDEDNN